MGFRCLTICLLALVSFISESYGYKTGAPSSPEICKTMVPGHGSAPQRGVSPFTIEVDNLNPIGGDSVKVWLRGNDQDFFKGFFVMAFKANQYGALEDTGIPHGTWTFEPNQSVQIVSCGGKANGAATHVSPDPKKAIGLEWKVPNEEGDYGILVTFVKEYSTYWVKVKSQPIKVKRDSQSEDRSPGDQYPSQPEVDPEAKKVLEKYADGCGKSKGCFGLPVGCLERGVLTCEMMTTFQYDGTNFLFQIAGKLPVMQLNVGHVSVGLSADQLMGNDLVTGCVMQNSKVSPKTYYNFPDDKQNVIARDPLEGLIVSSSTGGYKGGVLFCEFKRKPISKLTHEVKGNPKETFDLAKDKYYILLARAGELKILNDGSNREKLGRHPNAEDRGSSPNSYLLTDYKVAPGTTTGTTTKSGASESLKTNGIFILSIVILCYF